MPKAAFSLAAVPAFDAAPSVVLITGDVEFFVEEAAQQVAAQFAEKGAEVLRFDDEAPAEAVSDALLNRSLFSPQRVIQFDITRLLGSDAPGVLLEQAVEAWERATPAGKREAFRRARALLSALDLTAGASPEETAEAAAKRARKKDLAGPLAQILADLPEERGGPAVLQGALRLMLERGNDGALALVTATAPPAGVDLLVEIEKKGLRLDASIGEERKDVSSALSRLAKARAKEREVTLDADAIDRLRIRTDSNPPAFSAELEKLLDWAGSGGHVRASDVKENVEDEASEDIYEFFEAVGKRDAGDALNRLERLFSGRAVRAGERDIDTEEYWPTRFFGMFTDEVRKMLLVRSKMEQAGRGVDASTTYATFQARVVPLLAEPIAPFGVSPFAGKGGQFSAYPWFKAAQRSARYNTGELARALSRAADVDVKLKNSFEPLETLTAYVGELIAGN
jgi:hypothetical protein